MAEQELDLLELAAVLPGQLRAGAAQIMWGEVLSRVNTFEGLSEANARTMAVSSIRYAIARELSREEAEPMLNCSKGAIHHEQRRAFSLGTGGVSALPKQRGAAAALRTGDRHLPANQSLAREEPTKLMQINSALRRLNTWQMTGLHELTWMRVDELVAEQVMLGRLTGEEQTILRLAVEGFSQAEIAAECGCSAAPSTGA